MDHLERNIFSQPKECAHVFLPCPPFFLFSRPPKLRNWAHKRRTLKKPPPPPLSTPSVTDWRKTPRSKNDELYAEERRKKEGKKPEERKTHICNPVSPESVYNFNIVLLLPPAPAALEEFGLGGAAALRRIALAPGGRATADEEPEEVVEGP